MKSLFITLVFILLLVSSCTNQPVKNNTVEIDWYSIVNDAKAVEDSTMIVSDTDVFDIAFVESTIFIEDVPFTRVMELLQSPQEDMIVYCNHRVYKIIEE